MKRDNLDPHNSHTPRRMTSQMCAGNPTQTHGALDFHSIHTHQTCRHVHIPVLDPPNIHTLHTFGTVLIIFTDGWIKKRFSLCEFNMAGMCTVHKHRLGNGSPVANK